MKWSNDKYAIDKWAIFNIIKEMNLPNPDKISFQDVTDAIDEMIDKLEKKGEENEPMR